MRRMGRACEGLMPSNAPRRHKPSCAYRSIGRFVIFRETMSNGLKLT